MTRGIAHVSFSGGGIFLPARNPYDRQVLAEHVLSRVRAKGEVQVLIGNQRWLVQQRSGSRVAPCTRCQCSAPSACYLPAEGGAPYCVTCAFGDLEQPPPSQPTAELRMSS